MQDKFSGAIIIGVIMLLAGAYFIPWQKVSWGQISFNPSRTLTVVSNAQTQLSNEIAEFTAGVEAVGDNKEEVINKVNNEASKIVNALKNFGVKEADIKTQNMSIYQRQESYYDNDGVQKTRAGQWQASNSVSVVLRDKDQVDELSSLLAKSGATNVYGPNFRLEDSSQANDGPLTAALANARKKAEALAKDQNLEIVKVINITEGGSYAAPYNYGSIGMAGGGGDGGVMPGSTTVAGSVSVTYEVR